MDRVMCDEKNAVPENADQERFAFTGRELYQMCACFRYAFDGVRLLDPARQCELKIGEDGKLREKTADCASFCREAAQRALDKKCRVTAMMTGADGVSCVTVKYVEADGRPCLMELVSGISKDLLPIAAGQRKIADPLSDYGTGLYIDPVTGTYNRRYYADHCQHLRGPRGVAMIDVDDFKSANDTYGHAVGDQVLHAIASTIGSCVRAGDRLVRYGGDEFIIVFDGLPQTVLKDRLENIRSKVRSVRIEGCPELCLSVSIGGAYGGGSISRLIEEADKMMYRAKQDKDSVYITPSARKTKEADIEEKNP